MRPPPQPLLLLALLSLFTPAISSLPRLPPPTSHSPALHPRQPVCANAPSTGAGTAHPARKSTNTILWCAPNSHTYIILEMLSHIQTDAVAALLDEAINNVLGHLTVRGDGVIQGGGYLLEADGLGLATWDSNNHQQTWGVLGAALEALDDYMQSPGGYGRVFFTIVDGQNEVAEGMLS